MNIMADQLTEELITEVVGVDAPRIGELVYDQDVVRRLAELDRCERSVELLRVRLCFHAWKKGYFGEFTFSYTGDSW